ncbi:MAG: glycosyltransferase, partial [Pseudomonadota bacterium]
RYDIATPAGRVGFVFDMLLHHATVPMRRLAFNAEAVAWFAAPADGAVDGLGRLELLVAIEAGWLPRLSRLPKGEARAVIRARFRAQACRAFPALAAFSTLDHATWRAGDAMLEVAGMARSATGLGQNLWMTVSALDMLGLEVLVRDSEAAFEALAPAETSAAIGVHLGEARAPRPAASVPPGDCRPGTPGGFPAGPLTRLAPRRKALILHLNADAAPQALCHPLYDRHPDLWAIGFLLWELEALPRAHALALDLLDEIWCPTRFLAEIYARHTGTPVHTVGKAIALPEPAVVARHRFGLVPDDTVFLVTFDFHSSVERKNPLAALRAFQRAFGCPPARGAVRGPAGPRLVIKTTPPVAGHWGDPNGMWPAIVAAAERDPRIVLVTEHLPFTSLIGLVAMADALVSPHRAEGFGYMPAYALALERPVIATDYGGSRDFVTAETGYPVAWSPRALAPGESILPLAGAFWADVDVDAMARAMAAVAAAPEAAATRAAAGRRLIETEYSRAAQAARYRARLTASGILP